jgi:thioredoxin reductase (NADPH)
MKTTIEKLIIIGSGPAGLTAGIYAARANLNPIIIEGQEPGGQLMGTTYVENWPGEKKILGPTLMQNIREHAKYTGCAIKSGEITSVDFSKLPFTLSTKKEMFLAHSIIVATGAKQKRLGIPGETEYWGKGVTTCAVCDGALYKDKPVVIVGGGDTAMEDASFMTNYTDKITIIQISEKLSASAAMQQRVLNEPKINIIYNSTVNSIHGDGHGVTEIVVTNQKTKKEHIIQTNAVFVAVGLKPNTEPFKGHLALASNGYLMVNNHTHTSVAGIFAAGDVADYRYRQAITSAGSGCMAALDAERYIHDLDI